MKIFDQIDLLSNVVRGSEVDPVPARDGAEAATPRLSSSFRKKYFPQASQRDWNDWRWQMRNRVKSLANLEQILQLSDDERSAIERHQGSLPVGITPYYASLLDPLDDRQPLRRSMIMVNDEYNLSAGEERDPLDEDGHSPVPGLVHRYPDRVLFLVTGTCPVYCRYCTRSRMVGNPGGEYRFETAQWERAIDYIAATPSVRDVLISGGDPLTLSDNRLEWLLSRLRNIPHVEFLRIGTKVPAALPQRITPDLVRMLKRYHPLWMSIHFTHPDEITPEVTRACARLADAGIPLGAQTVLLAGINDESETLKRLFHGLLRIRVRPYYLYQCDPVAGSAHFRVPVERGLSLIRSLRGHTTGYAVPTYVIDAPGGGGKIPLYPDPVVGHVGDDLLLTNYEGKTFRYPDGNGNKLAPVRPGKRQFAGLAGTVLIGLTYDLREDYLREGFDQEETAEFDSPETIDAIEAALSSLGYRTVRIGNIRALASCLARKERWDLIFNIAEGLEGYGREAQVPALLDAYGIPYTFSDPLTMAIALHKGIAKHILHDRGIRTPAFEIVSAATDVQSITLPFPLFIKPVAEGSSKGISGASKVQNHDDLRSGCEELLQRYRQPVLVEHYLPGREFTVGIFGTGADASALGAMEVLLVNDADADGYTYDNKEEYEDRVRYRRADDEQGRAAIRMALDAWKVLGGRDGGRVDLRCDEMGRVNVIEVNPLPGLHPIRSDLVILGRMHGVSHAELIGRIMISAERRMFTHAQPRHERAPS